MVAMHGLQDLKGSCCLAPPRSYDVMQLFYGLFGTVRQQLALRGSGGVSWEATVAASLELLRAAYAQATMEASPARLKACM
jgi:hypothetical protein